jgi:uncharacterized protein involved in oxidation of intracellular sulfur
LIHINTAPVTPVSYLHMKFLLILNDPPYGTERSYNALRLARSLLSKEAGEVRMFLLGDAAACAKGGQKVPQGYYNVADMLSSFMRRSGTVSVCGTCLDARGITDADLVEGAARSSMDQLAEWSAWADKVLVF